MKGNMIDSLAEMPEHALLNEQRLAAELGVTDRTIRRMVNRRELPPGLKLGGQRFWMVGRVLSHLAAAAERAERDAQRRADKLRRHAP